MEKRRRFDNQLNGETAEQKTVEQKTVEQKTVEQKTVEQKTENIKWKIESRK
jgi:hypothetical protein